MAFKGVDVSFIGLVDAGVEVVAVELLVTLVFLVATLEFLEEANPNVDLECLFPCAPPDFDMFWNAVPILLLAGRLFEEAAG